MYLIHLMEYLGYPERTGRFNNMTLYSMKICGSRPSPGFFQEEWLSAWNDPNNVDQRVA